MDSNYREWRENRIKEIGLSSQMKAESTIDKQESQARLSYWDEKSKKKVRVRSEIGEILTRRKELSVPKKYFVMGK